MWGFSSASHSPSEGTFTSLELTWMLDLWCFASSTLCRTSLHVLRELSVIWCLAPPRCLCAAAGLFGRCDLCYLLCWCEERASWRQRSSARELLRELTLTQHLCISDEATVRATLLLGPHLQPGIVFKKHNREDICSKTIWRGVTSRLCSSDIPLL